MGLYMVLMLGLEARGWHRSRVSEGKRRHLVVLWGHSFTYWIITLLQCYPSLCLYSSHLGVTE